MQKLTRIAILAVTFLAHSIVFAASSGGNVTIFSLDTVCRALGASFASPFNAFNFNRPLDGLGIAVGCTAVVSELYHLDPHLSSLDREEAKIAISSHPNLAVAANMFGEDAIIQILSLKSEEQTPEKINFILADVIGLTGPKA
jgi:hypothetical protein